MDIQVALTDDLVEKGCANHVRMEELAVVGHIVLISRLVKDHIHPGQRLLPRDLVAGIAFQKLHRGVAVRMLSASVNPRLQVIQSDDFPVPFEKSISQIRANEPSHARNERFQSLPPFAKNNDRDGAQQNL